MNDERSNLLELHPSDFSSKRGIIQKPSNQNFLEEENHCLLLGILFNYEPIYDFNESTKLRGTETERDEEKETDPVLCRPCSCHPWTEKRLEQQMKK